jgi:hypothetical protein
MTPYTPFLGPKMFLVYKMTIMPIDYERYRESSMIGMYHDLNRAIHDVVSKFPGSYLEGYDDICIVERETDIIDDDEMGPAYPFATFKLEEYDSDVQKRFVLKYFDDDLLWVHSIHVMVKDKCYPDLLEYMRTIDYDFSSEEEDISIQMGYTEYDIPVISDEALIKVIDDGNFWEFRRNPAPFYIEDMKPKQP